ncbi:MAG: NrfD/PsrC family molybdoenzyme membrane anchor subunit [Thermodesulfobacteriota bacterium]
MIDVLYNVDHHEAAGALIAIYFYLTGISAGSFIVSTLAYVFGQTKFKPIGRIAVILATVVLILAPMALLIHVGRPFRAWRLFYNINFTSPISWGSFLLTLYPINCIIYGYFIFKNNAKMTKLFGTIGIPLAVAVHGYCGFILGFAKARHLWNTALMPILFLVSAIVSGVALVIFVVYIKDKFFSSEGKVNEELIFGLAKLMGGFLLLDLFLVLSDVLILLAGSEDAIKVGWLLLTGKFAIPFLGIENGLGKVVPAILIFSTKLRTTNRVVLASCLVMFGILFMRLIVVFAGEFFPLI